MKRLYRADPIVVAWWGTEVECVSAIARRHDLRAADALQLAAAFFAAEGRPPALEFVCLDDRLADAARREGFVTTPITGTGA